MSTGNAREETLQRLMEAAQRVDPTSYDLGFQQGSTPEVVRNCVLALHAATSALDDLIARLATLEHPDQARQVFESLAALLDQQAQRDELNPLLTIFLGLHNPQAGRLRGFEVLAVFLEYMNDQARCQLIQAFQTALEVWEI